MLARVCDICGRVITDDMAVVKDERDIYTKCNPHTITISCPRDCDWDLCPSCREKLYSWVQEQKATTKFENTMDSISTGIFKSVPSMKKKRRQKNEQ